MFNKMPIVEHWRLAPTLAPLGLDHVLAEAGDRPLDPEMKSRCRRDQADYGRRYHSELLFVLTRKRYAPEEAPRVWSTVLSHRDRLIAQLGRNPGIVLAAFDYLLNIEQGVPRTELVDDLSQARLVAAASRDPVTGLFDRTAVGGALQRIFGECIAPVSAVMLELDGFERFTDEYGLHARDVVLARLGSVVHQSVREGDVAARCDGDELCVVLPGRTLDEATHVADRLRARIAERLEPDDLTASLGVASFPEHAQDARQLLQVANQALRASRQRGGNRVSAGGRATTATVAPTHSGGL